MITLNDLDSETLLRFKNLVDSQPFNSIFIPWVKERMNAIKEKIVDSEEMANERREALRELERILKLPEQIVEIIKERKENS